MLKRLLLLLALPALALARNIPARPPSGVLQSCAASCVTGTGPSGLTGDTDVKFVATSGSNVIVFQTVSAGGVAVTVVVENSIDDGANWTTVTGTTMTQTNGISKTAVVNPVGWYRTNVTACPGGCTFTTRFSEERAVGQSW